MGCRVLCWGCFSCFSGESGEAGGCHDSSITARLEAANSRTMFLPITSQHSGHCSVSLCVRLDGPVLLLEDRNPNPGVICHLLEDKVDFSGKAGFPHHKTRQL